MTTPRALIWLISAAVAFAALPASIAVADPQDSPTKQAGQHFERGVALFNETDYRAALVELKRAYEIAPNAAVLYNLGQTNYQLQNYAAALSAFERFIAESGESPSHKQEVEDMIKTLRLRVGKIQITTSLPDTEITVDDDLVGRTPLTAAVVVSVGRRKVTALHNGRTAETRYVDVSAGDTVKVSVDFPTAASPGPTDVPALAATAKGPEPAHAHSNTTRNALWITTGVLAAGALTTGAFALKANSDLKTARNTFPETESDLHDKSRKVTTFSAIADIAGGAAVITGCFALYLTLSKSSTHEVHAGLTPTGILVGGTFK
jgi:hypothetical protein